MYRFLRRHGGKRRGHFHSRDASLAPAGFTRFAVQRNPYERIVSLWWATATSTKDLEGFYRRCGARDFATFVRWGADQYRSRRDELLAIHPTVGTPGWHDAMLLPQVDWQACLPPERRFRLESLVSDVGSLFAGTIQHLNAHGAISNKNPTPRSQPWNTYIGRADKRIIDDWFAVDFEMLGYRHETSGLHCHADLPAG
jgi:hypothetical protein